MNGLRIASITAALISAITACDNDAPLTAVPQPPIPPAAPQPTIRLVVIDSTHLPFAGTAEDRAAGHYVFQTLGAAPAIKPGDYVAGRQRGLFLGRVLSISRNADRLTLELAPAAWSDVFKPFKIRIPFTRGPGSSPSPYGVASWGPWHLLARRGQRPEAARAFRTATGAPVDPADFNPQDFSIGDVDLCSGGTVKICNISAKLIDAQFSLTGDVEAGADLQIPDCDITKIGDCDLTKVSLVAHATASEQLDASIDFQFGTFGATGQIGVEVPIGPGFVREFKVGPFEGELTVGLILGAAGTINGTIEPHAAYSETVATGAGFSTSSGFDFQFDAVSHFDAGVEVVDLGDVGVKVSLGPKAEVEIKIADGSFTLGAGADGFLEGTENIEGLVGSENWHVLVDAGTEASLEAGVKVPLIDVDKSAEKAFAPPPIDLVELWGTGDLKVTSSTTGSDVFPGQIYTVAVGRAQPNDPPPWVPVLSNPLAVNYNHLFTGGALCHQFFPGAPVMLPSIPVGPQDCNLVATGHTVDLSGIAWNCSPAEALPTAVQVRSRSPFSATARLTTLTLSVACRSAYAVARDRVNALLASGAIDNPNFARALLAKLTSAEAHRDAGDAADAGTVLRALMQQLRAQSGKHITAAAAGELNELVTRLAQCYVTLVPTCSTVPAAGQLAEQPRLQ